MPRPVAVALAAAGVYGLPFTGALGASPPLVRLAGWPLGLAAFAVLAGVTLLTRRSPVRWLYGLVGVPGRHWKAGPEVRAARSA